MTFLLVGLKVRLGFFFNDFTKDFTTDFNRIDFTNFYGFVKEMVQKNHYTYNIPQRSSGNPYAEVRSAEFDGTDGTGGWVGRMGRVGR